ncbi:MAG: hypothetical protein GY874_00625 [Desulfobacteraceae bacterium]|nr:hypothetical protein [Desulfobacteraceae bacterium]
MLNYSHTLKFPAAKSKDRLKIPQSKMDEAPLVQDDLLSEEEENWIVCKQCGQELAKPTERADVNGSHRHSFANPNGIIFEIGCFSIVRGCRKYGVPSAEFTWFPGYAWQVIVCAKCLSHLGWLFLSRQSGHFFGLILVQLAERPSKNH